MDRTSFKDEIIIKYPKVQKKLYREEDPKCIFPIWPHRYGIHRVGGNFAAMVVRKYFKDQGYSVLKDYLLIRCPGKRETNDGYHFLLKSFGKDKIERVIEESKKLSLRGGDPDLFVYRKNSSEFFFAEAKDTDKLTKNQLSLFPIIEKYLCPVLVVRIKAV